MTDQEQAPPGYTQHVAPPPNSDAAYPPPNPQVQPPVTGYPQPGGTGSSQPPETQYCGPPQGQQPGPQTGPQTVVVTTVSSGVLFRDVPVAMQCPNCQNHISSTCIYENGALVWLLVLLIAFVFQLWLGCCLIPLFIDGLKDVRHVCPVCNYQLGLYKRL